jgi:hypothetical protein
VFCNLQACLSCNSTTASSGAELIDIHLHIFKMDRGTREYLDWYINKGMNFLTPMMYKDEASAVRRMN